MGGDSWARREQMNPDFCSSFSTLLSLTFVSKPVPTGTPDLEENRTMSAGRYCPLRTFTMSPTAT